MVAELTKQPPTLSERQQAILRHIQAYHRRCGYAPSNREITEACGISSSSVTDYNLRALSRMGYIRRYPGIQRGIELIDQPSATPLLVELWTEIAVLHDGIPADLRARIEAYLGGAA